MSITSSENAAYVLGAVCASGAVSYCVRDGVLDSQFRATNSHASDNSVYVSVPKIGNGIDLKALGVNVVSGGFAVQYYVQTTVDVASSTHAVSGCHFDRNHVELISQLGYASAAAGGLALEVYSDGAYGT